MAPIEIEDPFKARAEEVDKIQKTLKVVRDFAIKKVNKRAFVTATEGECDAVGYTICTKRTTKKWIFRRTKTTLHMQVVDLRKSSRKWDWGIVVFESAKTDMARDAASFLTMVYKAKNIKVRVADKPENPKNLSYFDSR